MKGVFILKKTLVILAAGIGSRFGGGIKQLEPIDDFGHIIIDYSIHDAVAAGFNKIVFIIRHDIEEDFKNIIGNRIEKLCASQDVEIAYAFQEMDAYSTVKVDGRTKPWGTGHAVLCAADQIDSAFSVINADDYYGKEGFVKAADFLEKNKYGLVGDKGTLIGIDETKDIVKTAFGAESNDRVIDVESLVSMNFWCYPLEFIDILKKGFPEFQTNLKNPEKDEYLLPIIADQMLKEGYKYSVLPTDDQWFGVTYKEDKPAVVESFKKLIEDGVYKPEEF